MRIYRYALIFFSSLILIACNGRQDLMRQVDLKSFRYFGSTVMEEYKSVSLKELHLRKDLSDVGDVVVKGKVRLSGDHKTYLILGDDTAQILVDTTEVSDVFDFLKSNVDNKDLKILGKMKNGKKGLPVLKALSVNYGSTLDNYFDFL